MDIEFLYKTLKKKIAKGKRKNRETTSTVVLIGINGGIKQWIWQMFTTIGKTSDQENLDADVQRPENILVLIDILICAAEEELRMLLSI